MAIPGNFLSTTTESIDPNTSGWTPKLNCTISLGSGGRNGPGCLAVTSRASGEMQVRTVASYEVTAGTVYQAFADASGATVPERIGIRWLSPNGTEISTTWSLVTMSASATWHRISVAAAAPAYAALAQVVLSVMTPAAAGVVSYFENVYLGPPVRVTGNLFGFGTESVEIDTSGWTVETNATISRQVPVTTWPVDWYWAGGHMLAVTASAGGNMAARTVDQPVVTPGTEYLAFAYLQPPTSSSTAWIELRFYDSGGGQLQATRSVLAAPGTGFYRQYVSATAPAGAAKCGIAVGVDSATAGQILRVDTAAVTVAPQIVTGSVLPYASSSFEQSTGSWTVPAGVATLARSTPWGQAAAYGNYSLLVTSSTATSSTLRSPIVSVPGAAGQTWRAQISVKSGSGSWPTVTVRIRWYDAANVDLGASTGTSFSLPSGSWYWMVNDTTAPAGAAKAAVEVVAVASAASSTMNIDGVVLRQALPLTEVTAVDDDGYIKLTLRELDVTDLITVYRVTQDGTRTLVRGPSGLMNQAAIASDTLVIEDHEAPFNVSVSYYVEFYDGTTGAIAGTRSAAAVTLDLADVQEAWLKDPGNPQRNLRVLVAKAPDWQRPIEQASFVVRGRRNKVVLSGTRQGLEGDLEIWTRSDDERRLLHQLLDSGATLLWQAAPGMGVTDMYVSVGEIKEGRVSPLATEQWRAWTLPLTEQDIPVTVGVASAAGRTWQDVLSEFDTWGEVLSTYATWEDVFLDRRR
ncbi:hypothetical protein [Streptomyces sp. NPDC003395]